MKLATRLSSFSFIAMTMLCFGTYHPALARTASKGDSAVNVRDQSPRSTASENMPVGINSTAYESLETQADPSATSHPSSSTPDLQTRSANELNTKIDATPPDTTSLDLTSKPAIKLGLNASTFNLGASESMIAWERWHRAVGRAIHRRVQKVTTTSMGEVELDIRITNDCKITTQILRTNNTKMADICLNATQSLDGDTILIFPADSKRQAVHFKFEYKRGLFFLPKNHYITDDYEKLNEEAH